jgi:hypothetical protein
MALEGMHSHFSRQGIFKRIKTSNSNIGKDIFIWISTLTTMP